MYMHVYLSNTVGHLFRGLQISQIEQEGRLWKLFSQTRLAALLMMHVQLTCDGVSVNFQ